MVLGHNLKLLVFPLIAGISSLLFLGLLLGSTFGVLVGIEGLDAVGTRSGVLANVLAFGLSEITSSPLV